MSIFETLNSINVNDKTEKKNGLTYLSWAWAWGEVKKVAPEATFTIYERDTEFGPVNYFTDGRTCWVKTGLTINGLEHIEELPVMDFRNNPIPYDKVTSTDVNKAVQRSLTKAAARHGLGLYIYAGEDLPESEQEEKPVEAPQRPLNERIDAAVKNAGVEVVRASQLPPMPKKEEPKQEISPVTQFLLTAMSGLRQKRNISAAENNKLFMKQKDALVKAKLAPDKKSEDYTMEEATALIDAMEKCFDLLGTELKIG